MRLTEPSTPKDTEKTNHGLTAVEEQEVDHMVNNILEGDENERQVEEPPAPTSENTDVKEQEKIE